MDTYTPTLTILAGTVLSYDLTDPWLYSRSGNVVTVSGLVGVTTTGPGDVTTLISIPIPSSEGTGSGSFIPASPAAPALGPPSIVAMFDLEGVDVAVVNQSVLGPVSGALVQVTFQYLAPA